jgi:thiol-disulfide isomerase/thioredoxin
MHQGEPVGVAEGGLWITFWATWCEPCRAEWPDLELAAQTLAADRVTIVAVNVGESTAQIDQFLAQQHTSFTVLHDQDGTFATSWGVYGMPTHVLIDASGKVVRIVRGPLNAQRARDFFGLPQPAARFVPLGDGKTTCVW